MFKINIAYCLRNNQLQTSDTTQKGVDHRDYHLVFSVFDDSWQSILRTGNVEEKLNRSYMQDDEMGP